MTSKRSGPARAGAALAAVLVLAGCAGEPRPPQAELPTLTTGEKWCGLFAEDQIAAMDPGEPETRRQEIDETPREFTCDIWGDVNQPARNAPLIFAARTRAIPTRETMDESRTRVLNSLAPDGCWERVPDEEYERWACDNNQVRTFVTCLVPSVDTPGTDEERYYYTAVDGSFKDGAAHTAEELIDLSRTMDVFALNFHGCEERLPPESPQ